MLKKIQQFILEKKPKLDNMIREFYTLPEISLTREITVLNALLVDTRKWENVAVDISRNIELLQGQVKKIETDLEYLNNESMMKYLSDPEWLTKKNATKMAKDERHLLASLENKELYQARKEITMFSHEVSAFKRAASNKQEDLRRVSKELHVLIWGLRTEEYFKGGIGDVDRNRINQHLSAGSNSVNKILDPTKRY